MLSGLQVFNRNVPSEIHDLNGQTESVKLLKNHLYESLKLRVLNVPVPPGIDKTHDTRVAVLFSGGLDCTVLACMMHHVLPPEQHIDLINVAFENPRVVQAAKATPKARRELRKESTEQIRPEDETPVIDFRQSTETSPFECCPDRETGRKAFQELQNVCPGRIWRFIAV